jgi:hypothetical protein
MVTKRRQLLWSQERAIEFCRQLEPLAEKYKGHIALTGGTLYKDGERKDVDIVVYNHGTMNEFDRAGFERALDQELGIAIDRFGYVSRGTTAAGCQIDFIYNAKLDDSYELNHEDRIKSSMTAYKTHLRKEAPPGTLLANLLTLCGLNVWQRKLTLCGLNVWQRKKQGDLFVSVPLPLASRLDQVTCSNCLSLHYHDIPYLRTSKWQRTTQR